MKKILTIIAIMLFVGGACCNPKPKGDVDIRPPLMNTNPFTNFVPVEMSTNACSTNACSTNACSTISE